MKKEKAKAQHLTDQQLIDHVFELAEPAAADAATKHLKKCDACQRRAAELRATLGQLDLARETVKASDDLIIKTVRKVTAPSASTKSTASTETPRNNVIAWPRLAWIGFAAAAAVAVAVVLPKLKQQMSATSTVAMTAPAPARQNIAHKDADAVVKKEKSLASEVHALREAKADDAAAPAKVAPPVNEPIPVELAKLEEAPRDAERRDAKQMTDKSRMLVAAPAAPKPAAPSASQFRASGEAAAVGGSLVAAAPVPVTAPPAPVTRARSEAGAKDAIKVAEKPAEKPTLLAAANDELKLAKKAPAPVAATAVPAAMAEQKPASITLEAAKPVVVASAPAGAAAGGIARDAALDTVSESLRSSELVSITLPSVSGMWQAGPGGMLRVRASCDSKEVRLRFSNQGAAQAANIQIHPARGTNILLSILLEAGSTTNVTVKIPAKTSGSR